MKHNKKSFWTLDRHHAEGFTLVELIVVIAILAILAGVGIPVYSGYITKTNMTADRTLAAEVANALQLQYYADSTNFNGTSYVVLDTTGAKTDDVFAASAMQNAFGDSWNSVALKYDGWTDGATMLNLVMNNQYAASFNDSTYIDNVGTEQLLTDVQFCASSLAGFLTNALGDVNSGAAALEKYFGTDPEFLQNLTNAGRGTEDLTTEALSNATVFAIANNLTSAVQDDEGNTNAENVIYDFANGTYILNGLNKGTNDPDLLYEAANWYAATEAFVAYMGADFPELKAKFTEVNSSFSEPIPSYIIAQMNAFSTYVVSQLPNSAFQAKIMSYLDNTNGKSRAQMDGEAYVGIMTSVDGLSGDYTAKENNQLNNSNLFANDDVLERIDSLMSAALLSGYMGDGSALSGVTDSAIIVMLSDNNGEIVCQFIPTEAGN